MGVQAGTTFCSLKMDHMDGVDPNFLFDISEVASQRRHLHEMTSDQFFLEISELTSTTSFLLMAYTLMIRHIEIFAMQL